MENKPNCRKCEYRGTIPGDSHSECKHPEVAKLVIKGNPTGIRRGWFIWPFNYDPVWLDECNGFKEKEQDHEQP